MTVVHFKNSIWHFNGFHECGNRSTDNSTIIERVNDMMRKDIYIRSMEMRNKIVLGFAIIALFSLLTACENKSENSGSAEALKNDTAAKHAVSINKNEFDVNLNGIIINADIPFKSIAKELGIDIVTWEGINDSRTENYAANTPYAWNIVHYPNKENEEISIEYVYNEETGESYVVQVNLFKDTETYRGIKVGDSLDKFLKAYSGRIYESG